MEMSLTCLAQEYKNDLINTFDNTYSKRDMEYLLERVRASIGLSNYSSELFYLRKALLECGIQTEPNREISCYAGIVEQAYLPQKEDLNHRVDSKLLEIFQDYPRPSDFLERIVCERENPADGWANAPLRLRILRQFFKYCNGFVELGIGGKNFLVSQVKQEARKAGIKNISKEQQSQFAYFLTDDVFSVLQEADENQQKPRGKYELLKIVDDLAKGNFRPGGKTRQSLYLFAIAYGMTFYYGDGQNIPQYQTSIEKLFVDYYNNNLVRFLEPDYQSECAAGGLEVDPSGRGINVKNFAELVFIYWIVQNITPLEKIQGIQRDMKIIKRRRRNAGRCTKTEQTEEATQVYWTRVQKSAAAGKVVFEMDENEMIDYLLAHYNCTPDKTGPFAVAGTQKSACSCYKAAVDQLKEEIGSSGNDLRLSICNQWLFDMPSGDDEERTLKKLFPNESPETVRKFNILTNRLKQLLHLTPRDLNVDGSNTSWQAGVTRTKLLAVYYCIYNLQNLDHPEPKNLSRVFDDLAQLPKAALEQSGYQTLNVKNLFDVLLSVSAYVYLTA